MSINKDEHMDALRKKINQIDDEIIELLIQRFHVTQQVGEHKKKYNLSIKDERREREILDSLVKRVENSLKNSTINQSKDIASSDTSSLNIGIINNDRINNDVKYDDVINFIDKNDIVVAIGKIYQTIMEQSCLLQSKY